MLICIDSCTLIYGLEQSDLAAVRLLELIGPDLRLVISRLIVQEVTRNLSSSEQIRHFHRLIASTNFVLVVDEPVPPKFVQKYIQLGLREKADAFVGAFAEWMEVAYFISDNRHFLRDLRTDAFKVLSPAEFILLWEEHP
jgi:hypothetical protein